MPYYHQLLLGVVVEGCWMWPGADNCRWIRPPSPPPIPLSTARRDHRRASRKVLAADDTACTCTFSAEILYWSAFLTVLYSPWACLRADPAAFVEKVSHAHPRARRCLQRRLHRVAQYCAVSIQLGIFSSTNVMCWYWCECGVVRTASNILLLVLPRRRPLLFAAFIANHNGLGRCKCR